MKVDLCDLRRLLRADFFAKDRDVTLQAGRVFDGLGIIPVGGIILWSGAIGAIPTGWQICDGTNGTPDLRNRFVIGAGDTYVVDATGGSTTKDLSHTHAVGTLAAANESAHTHGIGSYAAANESAHTHGIGSYAAANESSHTHGDGSYAAANDTHSHDVTGTSASESSHTHGSGTLSSNVPSAGTGHVVDYGVDTTLLSKATFDAHAHEIDFGSTDAGSSHSHGDGTYAAANDTHNHDVTGTSAAGSAHTHSLSGSSAAGSAHTHSLSGSSAAGSAHTHSLSGSTATGGSAAQDIMPPYYALAYIMRMS